MAGLSVELRRKCAAVESLDKAVEDAHCQIELLKDSEQEANRLIAAMSKVGSVPIPLSKNISI